MEICRIVTEQSHDVEMIDTSSKPIIEYRPHVGLVSNQFGYVTLRFNTTLQATAGQYYSFTESAPMPNMFPSTFPSLLTGSVYNAWSTTTLSQSSRCTASLFIDMLNTTGGKLVTWQLIGAQGIYPDITALAPGNGGGYFASMFALCVASPNTVINQAFTSLALTGVSGWNFNVDMSFIPVTRIYGLTALGLQVQSAVISGSKPYRLSIGAEFGQLLSAQYPSYTTLTTIPEMIVDDPTYIHNPNYSSLYVETQTGSIWSLIGASLNLAPSQISATAFAKQIVGLQTRSNQFTYSDVNATIQLKYIATYIPQQIAFVPPTSYYFIIEITPLAATLQPASLTKYVQILTTLGGTQTDTGLLCLIPMTGARLNYTRTNTQGESWDPSVLSVGTVFTCQVLGFVTSVYQLSAEFPNQFDITTQIASACSQAVLSRQSTTQIVLTYGAYSVTLQVVVQFTDGRSSSTDYFLQEDNAVQETIATMNPNRYIQSDFNGHARLSDQQFEQLKLKTYREAFSQIQALMLGSEVAINKQIALGKNIWDVLSDISEVKFGKRMPTTMLQKEYNHAYDGFVVDQMPLAPGVTQNDFQNFVGVGKIGKLVKEDADDPWRNEFYTEESWHLANSLIGKTGKYAMDKYGVPLKDKVKAGVNTFTKINGNKRTTELGYWQQAAQDAILYAMTDTEVDKVKAEQIAKSDNTLWNMAKFGFDKVVNSVDVQSALTSASSNVADNGARLIAGTKDLFTLGQNWVLGPPQIQSEIGLTDANNYGVGIVGKDYGIKQILPQETFLGLNPEDREQSFPNIFTTLGRNFKKMIGAKTDEYTLIAYYKAQELAKKQAWLATQMALDTTPFLEIKAKEENEMAMKVRQGILNGIETKRLAEEARKIAEQREADQRAYDATKEEAWYNTLSLAGTLDGMGSALSIMMAYKMNVPIPVADLQMIKSAVSSVANTAYRAIVPETKEQIQRDKEAKRRERQSKMIQPPQEILAIEGNTELQKELESYTDEQLGDGLNTVQDIVKAEKIEDLEDAVWEEQVARARVQDQEKRLRAEGRVEAAMQASIKRKVLEKSIELNQHKVNMLKTDQDINTPYVPKQAIPIMTTVQYQEPFVPTSTMGSATVSSYNQPYVQTTGDLKSSTNNPESVMMMRRPATISTQEYMDSYSRLLFAVMGPHPEMMQYLVNPMMTKTSGGRLMVSESFKELAIKITTKFGAMTAMQSVLLQKTLATYFRVAAKVCQMQNNLHGSVQFRVYTAVIDPLSHQEHQIQEQVDKYLHKRQVYDSTRSLSKIADKKLDAFSAFVSHADKTQDFIEKLVMHIPEHGTNITDLGMYISGRNRRPYETNDQPLKLRQFSEKSYPIKKKVKQYKQRAIGVYKPSLEKTLRQR